MSETIIRLIAAVIIDAAMVIVVLLFFRTVRQWQKLGDRTNVMLDAIKVEQDSSILLQQIQSRPNCNDCAKGGGCGNGACPHDHGSDTVVYGCPLWEGAQTK